MKNIIIKTWNTEDFKVHQTIVDEFTERVIDVATAQLDECVREQLIRLGWTPPKET